MWRIIPGTITGRSLRNKQLAFKNDGNFRGGARCRTPLALSRTGALRAAKAPSDMDGEHGEFPVSALQTQTAKYVRNRCGIWLQEVGRGPSTWLKTGGARVSLRKCAF